MNLLVHFFPDLRWNNIGLLGGRSFLEMLKANKVVSRLELAGNNVPSDISKAIGMYVLHYIDIFPLIR